MYISGDQEGSSKKIHVWCAYEEREKKKQRDGRPQPFLASSIPDLSLDDLAFNGDGPSLELNTNGRLWIKAELILGKPGKNLSLAYCRVTDHHHLEHIIYSLCSLLMVLITISIHLLVHFLPLLKHSWGKNKRYFILIRFISCMPNIVGTLLKLCDWSWDSSPGGKWRTRKWIDKSHKTRLCFQRFEILH